MKPDSEWKINSFAEGNHDVIIVGRKEGKKSVLPWDNYAYINHQGKPLLQMFKYYTAFAISHTPNFDV